MRILNTTLRVTYLIFRRSLFPRVSRIPQALTQGTTRRWVDGSECHWAIKETFNAV